MAVFAQSAVRIVLIPILAVFFLKDGRKLTDSILDTARSGVGGKNEFSPESSNLNEMLAHYATSQVILAGLSLVAYMVVLSLLRVPYAAVLGSVAA